MSWPPYNRGRGKKHGAHPLEWSTDLGPTWSDLAEKGVVRVHMGNLPAKELSKLLELKLELERAKK